MVERFNGTLKNMLHKLTADKPHTWDKLIPAESFPFREILNSTTGYRPFTLMYGRQERQLITLHDIIPPHAAMSFIKDDNVDLKANIAFLRKPRKNSRQM
ncbi:hypothetical protein RRG08_063130 [Elysia crispata]|uniref:Integrase catalytic domain-containing protein n=1 Tax=Elysia crispata TaxID=231223 RepID=A0AAE1ABR2_9GAST|nr:hypothetical protein RRG08_063130 [Elysia crispata]